jgi:hypothetical protein
MVVVVLVVIILVVGVASFFLLPTSSPPVQVNDINAWAPDNVCGLGSNPSYFSGFNGSTGQVQQIDFGMPNYNSTPCTIQSVVTNSTGFLLSGVQAPLTIAGNGTASMNITVQSPSGHFSGDLNLVFR